MLVDEKEKAAKQNTKLHRSGMLVHEKEIHQNKKLHRSEMLVDEKEKAAKQNTKLHRSGILVVEEENATIQNTKSSIGATCQ